MHVNVRAYMHMIVRACMRTYVRTCVCATPSCDPFMRPPPLFPRSIPRSHGTPYSVCHVSVVCPAVTPSKVGAWVCLAWAGMTRALGRALQVGGRITSVLRILGSAVIKDLGPVICRTWLCSRIKGRRRLPRTVRPSAPRSLVRATFARMFAPTFASVTSANPSCGFLTYPRQRGFEFS